MQNPKITYKVVTLRTGFFSGNLNPAKLEKTINDQAQIGWILDKTIKETTRQMLLMRRETHMLIFRNK